MNYFEETLSQPIKWASMDNETKEMMNATTLKSTRKARILAVGGGKGGVGKSVVATLLGITLASMGKKTILLDADFSGANLHGYLGTFDMERNLSAYFQRRTYDLNDLAQKTFVENLYLVAGTPGLVGAAHFKFWEKQKLLRGIRRLDADYVILDLGAGNEYTTIDIFNAADDGIIVAHADSLSIHDAYGFIRVALLRSLQRTFRSWPEILEKLEEYGNLANASFVKPMKDYFHQVSSRPQSLDLLIENKIRSFRPKLILNQVQEEDSGHEIQALRLASKDLLNVHIDYWGQIRADDGIKFAIRNFKPELMLTANSKASEDIVRIVNTNIIARELKANRQHSGWAQFENDRLKSSQEHIPICSVRCIAWNCCSAKNGGLPCTVMTPLSLRKAAS